MYICLARNNDVSLFLCCTMAVTTLAEACHAFCT